MSNPPPELQLDFVDDAPPAVYTDVPELQEQEEPSPIVEMKAMMDKEPIDDSDIFGDVVVAPRSEPEPAPAPAPAPVKKRREKPVKYNKDGSVRKPRQYTDEQRRAMSERMKKVRLQAHKNKAKKDEERAKEAKHKELLKAKRDMEIEEMEAKIKRKPSPQPKEDKGAPLPRTDTRIGLTREDIEKAQFEAIMKYETLRKERKAKKKQAQQVENYHKEVKENLKKELGWRDVAGPYADCF